MLETMQADLQLFRGFDETHTEAVSESKDLTLWDIIANGYMFGGLYN